jgi:hypothetical protein
MGQQTWMTTMHGGDSRFRLNSDLGGDGFWPKKGGENGSSRRHEVLTAAAAKGVSDDL